MMPDRRRVVTAGQPSASASSRAGVMTSCGRDAVLSVLSALGIIHIGVSYLTWPVAIAQGFGVPDLPVRTDPFHRVKGIRDVASGLVLTDRGRRGTAYGVHGETAMLLVVNAGLWLLG